MTHTTTLLRCLLFATLFFVISCSNTSDKTTAVEVSTIRIIADEDTRTALTDENRVCWEAGDRLAVIENSSRIATSDEAQIDDDGRATFNVSFESNILEKIFSYDAIYPHTAIDEGSLDGDILTYRLPSVQHPTAVSFDPAADILISQRVTHILQPSILSLRFKRLVALGELTLLGLPEDTMIGSVTFTATDSKLSGCNTLGLTSREVVDYGSKEASASVTAEYATPISADTPIYFACNPVLLSEGNSFTIEVVCGEQSYVRSVTIAEGGELRFESGAITHFSVDMSSAVGDDGNNGDDGEGDDQLTDGFAAGDYLIVVDGKMMATYKSAGGHFQSADYDEDSDNSSAVWHFISVENGYILSNSEGNKYIAVGSTNKIKLEDSADSATTFVVTASDVKGCYTIHLFNNKNYYLQYNTKSPRFAIYELGEGMIADLQLIPVNG